MANPLPFEQTSSNLYWPTLDFTLWQTTCETLHLWTQIVGKIRLKHMPWVNHSWHAPLYVNARGLTTGAMSHGNKMFQIQFDFIEHSLIIEVSDGQTREIKLYPRSVAHFYEELFAKLQEIDLSVKIHHQPNEVGNPIPFVEDKEHASYDADYATKFWQALVQTERVFTNFRARFIGKCSPVHFFWGSFDLALTRFSGREAPPHPGGIPNLPDEITREAYSHEVSSCGFWPGNAAFPTPVFYSYAYPTPSGFGEVPIQPSNAFFNKQMGEFMLPYSQVQQAFSPDKVLLDFLQSTYEAAADLAKWDRLSLERNTNLQ